jgi:hypothetical protein
MRRVVRMHQYPGSMVGHATVGLATATVPQPDEFDLNTLGRTSGVGVARLPPSNSGNFEKLLAP